jgi:hypothetical protein
MNTRPNGLHTPAQPVAERDPYSLTAQVEGAMQLRARAVERRAGTIEYDPHAASEKQLAAFRLAIELSLIAANLGVPACEMWGTRR